MVKKKILSVLSLGALVLGSTLSACGGSAEYDQFAQCLNDKGAIMYEVYGCSACKRQKNLFGDSFQYINSINCDEEIDVCLKVGITVFPTWETSDKLYGGVLQLPLLGEIYDCELPEDEIEEVEDDSSPLTMPELDK